MTEKMEKPTVDLKELAAKQEKRTVEIVDAKGKKTGEKVELTVEVPSWRDQLAMNDLQNVGNNMSDTGELYAQLLDKVLVNPRLDFKVMNEAIENDKDLKQRTITFIGKDDKEHKLIVKFPNYRDALTMLSVAQLVDGAYNMLGFMTDATKYLFKDSKGKAISDDYWDKTGGMYNAMAEAIDYLNEVMNINGYRQILNELYTFFQEKSV